MRIPPQTNELLKRLHSLLGMIPIGLFLIEHLWANSMAVRGPGVFNDLARRLAATPGLRQIEIFGVALPLAFHLGLGILIATEEQPAEGRRHYASDVAYLAQRATGVFVAFFVIWHVWETRLSPAVLAGNADLFALMERHLARPGTFALYLLGVVAAAAHLGNGLFAFAVRWGLAARPGPRRTAAWLGWVVFAVLALAGANSLLAFRHRAVRIVRRSEAGLHARHTTRGFGRAASFEGPPVGAPGGGTG